MLFNSLAFSIFFPTVCLLYFLTRGILRSYILLASSCFFYMWFVPKYILILGTTIVVDYLAAILMEKFETNRIRKLILIFSIVVTCCILFYFKYYNFFISNTNQILISIGWKFTFNVLEIALPVGLSFHTFQSLAYVIEVYRRQQKAERNFINYSLYVMFFPQLVAGPIERPQNLLHQFSEAHTFDYARVTSGLRLMGWGLLKKVVIADRLAQLVNPVFDDPRTMDRNGILLLISSIFFAFEIYCDFSGYSDMAIGAARVLGFRLMTNFKTPYFSKSVTEFWRRWHISLSTWFKDYVFIPMGGSRGSSLRLAINVMTTFCLSGLWHGASWTFVIWGALNGAFVTIEHLFSKIAQRPSIQVEGVSARFFDVLKIGYTFSLVTVTWIFFRAKSLDDAIFIVRHLFDRLTIARTGIDFGINTGLLPYPQGDYWLATATILSLVFVEMLRSSGSPAFSLKGKPIALRWGLYSLILWIIVFGGRFNETKFIYFVF